MGAPHLQSGPDPASASMHFPSPQVDDQFGGPESPDCLPFSSSEDDGGEWVASSLATEMYGSKGYSGSAGGLEICWVNQLSLLWEDPRC